MFDGYLRQRSARTGEAQPPFDSAADYGEYVDGKPRSDGVRSFLASRGIELPEGDADDPPDAETVAGLGNRKNELVLELIREQGVEAYEGSVRYLEAARDASLGLAVVSSSTNCRDVLAAAGIESFFDVRIDGVVAEREHLKGKPAPDTFLAAARALGVGPEEATVFEDALAGVAAGRAGGFACVVGVDRVGHADGLREHGATVVVDDLVRAARGPMIRHPSFSCEPWAVCEIRSRSLRTGPQRVGLRPRQRAHRAPREPRGGRAARPARDLPQQLLRDPAAALPRGRLRLPRGRAGGAQRHQRQDHPAARRRRAVRRPLRAAAKARANARLPGRPVAPGGRMDLAGGPGCAGQLRAPCFPRAQVGRRDPVRGRAARRAGPVRRPVRAGRQRAAAGGGRGRSAGPGRASARLSNRSSSPSTKSAWCSSTAPRRAGCGWPPAWTT